jgi:hypothetical protein
MRSEPEVIAYQKGYRAGREKRLKEDIQLERNEVWRSVYSATLAALMTTNGSVWKLGGKPVTSIEDRITLAEEAADRAIALFIRRGRV